MPGIIRIDTLALFSPRLAVLPAIDPTDRCLPGRYLYAVRFAIGANGTQVFSHFRLLFQIANQVFQRHDRNYFTAVVALNFLNRGDFAAPALLTIQRSVRPPAQRRWPE